MPLLAAEPLDYLREVKPLLTVRCYACHGALQQKGGLRVDTAQSFRAGGDHGPALVPRKSDESLVLAHVTGAAGKKRMPPPSEGEALTSAQVALLKAWIDQGAIGPVDEKPESDPREHWAFRSPVRPAVPQVHDPSRIRNPIDAFLQAGREKHGLSAQPAADRAILLRRVTLDLVGLPPTRAELLAFLRDPSPDAYEKVIERLLSSPQYGERWGRHWMDVWRYSDWWGLGAEVRNSQKHIWHWRDWIIESLNNDTGYDQMLREMLAADEFYPNDLSRLRATGFLARQYFKFNRNSWLEETVEHTGKAFLGLTLNCARCHDHKYDPITSVDYYRFRAFFEPYQVRTEQLPGEIDYEKDGIPRAFDCNLDAPTYRFVRGDEKQPVKDRPLLPGMPKLLAPGGIEIRPVKLPPEAQSPGLRDYVRADHLRVLKARLDVARFDDAVAGLAVLVVKPGPDEARIRQAAVVAEKSLAAVEAAIASLTARAAADRAKAQGNESKDLTRQAARDEKLAALAAAEEALARAELDVIQAATGQKPNAEQKRDAARAPVEAARKSLETPGETYTPLVGAMKTLESNQETEASRLKPFPTTSTGRRSALAGWLTDAKNPLTARVAVNHIWARHFGTPLVPTVFDFGRKGTPPTHPELLDWLARELIENGWSMKHLHRLIVTSDAYRMTSSSVGTGYESDPENRWYWRMNPVRMESEVVRDSLLHLAGELDPKMGGSSLPAGDEASRRRGLYFVHSHNEHQRFLSMFDDASVLECYRRAESIVPQQALALANSRFALTMALRINKRLQEQLGDVDDAVFVQAAFETVLGSAPNAAEKQESEMALKQLTELFRSQKRSDAVLRARGDLIQALLNHNDFLTVR